MLKSRKMVLKRMFVLKFVELGQILSTKHLYKKFMITTQKTLRSSHQPQTKQSQEKPQKQTKTPQKQRPRNKKQASNSKFHGQHQKERAISKQQISKQTNRISPNPNPPKTQNPKDFGHRSSTQIHEMIIYRPQIGRINIKKTLHWIRKILNMRVWEIGLWVGGGQIIISVICYYFKIQIFVSMASRKAPASKVPAKKKVERPGLTEDEIQQLREAFNLFDTEATGKIDPRQLKSAMQSLGFESKNPTIFNMIADLESEGREIDFQEFLDAITSKLGDKQTRNGINRIFDLFDDDRTGSININNIRRVAKQLGETMNGSQLEQMLQRAASNGREISREDFYNIMTKKTI